MLILIFGPFLGTYADDAEIRNTPTPIPKCGSLLQPGLEFALQQGFGPGGFPGGPYGGGPGGHMGPYGGGPGVAGIPGHVGNFGGNFGRGGFVPRGGRGGPGAMGFGPGQFGGRGGFNPAMAGGRGGLGKKKVYKCFPLKSLQLPL